MNVFKKISLQQKLTKIIGVVLISMTVMTGAVASSIIQVSEDDLVKERALLIDHQGYLKSNSDGLRSERDVLKPRVEEIEAQLVKNSEEWYEDKGRIDSINELLGLK